MHPMASNVQPPLPPPSDLAAVDGFEGLEMYLTQREAGVSHQDAIEALSHYFDLTACDAAEAIYVQLPHYLDMRPNRLAVVEALVPEILLEGREEDADDALEPGDEGGYEEDSDSVTLQRPDVLVAPPGLAPITPSPAQNFKNLLAGNSYPPGRPSLATTPASVAFEGHHGAENLRLASQRLYQLRNDHAYPTARPSLAGSLDTRRAGADGDDGQSKQDLQIQTALAVRQVAASMQELHSAHNVDKTTAENSLSALRGSGKYTIFLARGCDTHEVKVCPGLLGKVLSDALRRAGDGGRALLDMCGFPVPMSNCLAFGIVGGAWGGRTHASAPDHCLTAADFPMCSHEVFDNDIPPHSNSREPRPRPVTTIDSWKRQTDNPIKAFALVYGMAHGSEQ